MKLSSPLTDVTGIGPAQASKFKLLGLATVDDLVHYWPRRYDDYSQLTALADLTPGNITVAGQIMSAKGRYVRRGMHITEALLSDGQSSVRLIWFNQPYREAALKAGQDYYVSGNYELSHQRFAIMNPTIELKSEFPINTARVVPVYRETKGLTSRMIRAALAQTRPLLAILPETLPAWLVKQQKLLAYHEAVTAMHFPASDAQLQAAQRRLGFEEVFCLSLASLLNKQANQQEVGQPIAFDESLAQQFVAHLPFQLTDAQRRVVWQIYQDLQRPQPMNRIVEGDVGSGKTVIAVMAALMTLAAQCQIAFMAPTELLARQHAETISQLLKGTDYADSICLLVGSMTNAQKQIARSAIRQGRASFLIGTQALIQDSVDMHSLALIIVDEQHRFGVEQRKTLMAKAGHMPHVLSLTATPIPRSLALTLYGELDVSVLDSKPIGRLPIITQLISPNSRQQVKDELNKQLDAGRQVFVVCPVIVDSETLDLKSVTQVYAQYKDHHFKDRRVGLLHGQLKTEQKNAIMDSYLRHELDILVATTVIEVGVDVPNASVMVVESPERFGLAQLHQLRGRVGRSQYQGYCYVMLSDSQAPSKRLRALATSNDGFRLSELDLELRGPGAIYGSLQHGQLDLRIAKLSDTKLIAAARTSAQGFISKSEQLNDYPLLSQTVRRLRAVTNLN